MLVSMKTVAFQPSGAAMKLSEVPQDDIKTLDGVKKALYALDEQGRYTRAATSGWEAEETVLSQVIADFAAKAASALQRVKSSETSPIEYFMYKRWMDPLTLAQSMGLFRWQVRRHFNPSVFRKLDERILAEYARLFGITLEALKRFPREE